MLFIPIVLWWPGMRPWNHPWGLSCRYGDKHHLLKILQGPMTTLAGGSNLHLKSTVTCSIPHFPFPKLLIWLCYAGLGLSLPEWIESETFRGCDPDFVWIFYVVHSWDISWNIKQRNFILLWSILWAHEYVGEHPIPYRKKKEVRCRRTSVWWSNQSFKTMWPFFRE